MSALTSRRRAVALAFAGLAGLAALACGGATPSSSGSSGSSGGSSGSNAATPASPASAAVVKTKTAKVGGKSETVLTDSKGLTLYYFTADKGGKVTCTGGCASLWPALMAPSGSSKPSAAGGVTGTLGTVAGPSGGLQVTYNGWPLYTYAKDKDEGDVYGQGVNGKWYAATPDLAASPSY